MNDMEKVVTLIVEELAKQGKLVSDGIESGEANLIPVGTSNRHLHLSDSDLEALFGKGYKLTSIKDLSQPGQFACKETVNLIGPKGIIENVRILGPTRSHTQVEIFAGDCFKLGVNAPLRVSGNITGTPGLSICGPLCCVNIDSGVIVAKRHIHMTKEDAKRFDCVDGEIVSAVVEGERGGLLGNVEIRVTDASKLDFHIDTEEANCMGIKGNTKVKIIK